MYSVYQKILSFHWGILNFFLNGWEFVSEILHVYCVFKLFISTTN